MLRSVWGEPRPPHAPPLGWRDWALVGTLAVVVLLEGALRADVPWRAVSVAVTLGLLPCLLWRRSKPLLMVAVAFGVCGVVPLLTAHDVPSLNSLVYLLLLTYSLFRWGSGREAVIGAAIVFTKIGLSVVDGSLVLAEALGGVAIVTTTLALGAALRYRTRARQRELDQVKLLERERLARDLHDTVAHHVSAMAIRAQAGLATSGSHPDAAADALRVIEAEASRALTEMRTMVRVLRRNEPADRAPNPSIADIEQLAGRSRGGPAVDVQITGDLDDIPPPVGTALFRMAQESVTNARRHARHATRIEVRVAADDASVHLRVSDDGETSGPRSGSQGYGIIGMIERADLLGGACEAGPDPERGWTVTARLPRTGSVT